MSFIEFQDAFSFLPIIPIGEIEKQFPDFDVNALTRWQRKGYLTKIRNGFYRLSRPAIAGEKELFFVANQIYHPSYISLHSALNWYGYIPEGVFTITSVSTRKTQLFKTREGNFSYKKIKPELFFGYRLEAVDNFRFKIATPEKALLDLLYFYPYLKSEADFFELRLNPFEMEETFNVETWNNWLSLFHSKALRKRADKFLKFYHNDVLR